MPVCRLSRRESSGYRQSISSCLVSCVSLPRSDRASSCHSAPPPTSRSRGPRPGCRTRRRHRPRDRQVPGTWSSCSSTSRRTVWSAPSDCTPPRWTYATHARTRRPIDTVGYSDTEIIAGVRLWTSVPDMTYNVFGGTLSLYAINQSIARWRDRRCVMARTCSCCQSGLCSGTEQT